MVVQIVSEHSEQYQFLEKLYQGNVRFSYFTGWEDVEASEEYAEVILTDPALAAGDPYVAAQIRRGIAEGRSILLCAPQKKKSLLRELRAAGLETGLQDAEMSDGVGASNSVLSAERKPKGRPDYRHVFGVVEITREADAGLVVMMMAEELASEAQRDDSLVTIFAPEHDCFYYALGLGSHLQSEGFQEVRECWEHWIEESEEDAPAVVPNLLEGISWLTGSGRKLEKQERGVFDRAVVTGKVPGNYVLCCYSAEEFERELPAASEYLDAVLVVTDSRPSSLMAGAEHLRRIRESDLPAVYAVSHTSHGVRQDLVLDFLETQEAFFLPEIDSAVRCEAEYAETNPYRFEEIRKPMMAPIAGMIEGLKKQIRTGEPVRTD